MEICVAVSAVHDSSSISHKKSVKHKMQAIGTLKTVVVPASL